MWHLAQRLAQALEALYGGFCAGCLAPSWLDGRHGSCMLGGKHIESHWFGRQRLIVLRISSICGFCGFPSRHLGSGRVRIAISPRCEKRHEAFCLTKKDKKTFVLSICYMFHLRGSAIAWDLPMLVNSYIPDDCKYSEHIFDRSGIVGYSTDEEKVIYRA